MIIRFLEPAKQELDDVVTHYENERPGLGADFASEVIIALQKIRDFPGAWTKLSKNTRRCRTDRFPYGLVFSVLEEEIVIVAVMHLRRKPGYWKGRK